jgi:hypothetical protein
MARKTHVFGWEHEPANERPTGVVQSTLASGWVVSQQSTFDQPSRAVRNNAGRQSSARFVAVLALAVATLVATAAFALNRFW